MIDFKQIRKDFPIEQVATFLSLDTSFENGELRAPCPRCKKGGERARRIRPAVGYFDCFVATAREGQRFDSGHCVSGASQ